MKKVIVIGDSTASSLGGESDSWLLKLSQDKNWSQNVRVIDTCVPGATAGSAFAALLKQILKSPLAPKRVIISLGNCDKIQKPYRANRPSIFKVVRRILLILQPHQRKVKRIWPKLTYTEWIEDDFLVDQSIEDFQKSLIWLKKLCLMFRIPIIAIIPRSNIEFFPGTASNNTPFFNLIGDTPNFGSKRIDFLLDPKLLEEYAFSQHVSDKKVASLLNEITLFNEDQTICAINNLAVQWVYENRIDQAKDVLEFLINIVEVRKEIFYFNLAHLERLAGNRNKYLDLLEKANVEDQGSYRVDLHLSQVFRLVFQPSDNVTIIDLKDSVFDAQFLDHCHLLPDGQQLLVQKIQKALERTVFSGTFSAQLIWDLENPEVLEGDSRGFRTFFGIESKVGISTSEAFPNDQLIKILGKSIHRSRLPNTRFRDLIQSAIFLYLFQKTNGLGEISLRSDVIREHRRVKTIFEQMDISTNFGKLNFEGIESAHQLLGFDSIICEGIEELISDKFDSRTRLKKIMSWYFTESIYFGFSSSISMCFDRNKLRSIRELTIIAWYVSRLNNHVSDVKYERLLEFLTRLEQEFVLFYTSNRHNIYTGSLKEDENMLLSKLRNDWKLEKVKNELG